MFDKRLREEICAPKAAVNINTSLVLALLTFHLSNDEVGRAINVKLRVIGIIINVQQRKQASSKISFWLFIAIFRNMINPFSSNEIN